MEKQKYGDNRPTNWTWLFITLVGLAAIVFTGFYAAGKKLNIGPFAPTATATATATPTGAPTVTPTITPRPTSTPLPVLSEEAWPLVDQAFTAISTDPVITLGKIVYLGKCIKGLVTNSEGQICMGWVIPDLTTKPTEDEGSALSSHTLVLLNQLVSQYGWRGRIYVIFMNGSQNREIVAAYAFYLKEGDNETLWYADLGVTGSIPSPDWIAGR